MKKGESAHKKWESAYEKQETPSPSTLLYICRFYRFSSFLTRYFYRVAVLVRGQRREEKT